MGTQGMKWFLRKMMTEAQGKARGEETIELKNRMKNHTANGMMTGEETQMIGRDEMKGVRIVGTMGDMHVGKEVLTGVEQMITQKKAPMMEEKRMVLLKGVELRFMRENTKEAIAMMLIIKTKVMRHMRENANEDMAVIVINTGLMINHMRNEEMMLVMITNVRGIMKRGILMMLVPGT